MNKSNVNKGLVVFLIIMAGLYGLFHLIEIYGLHLQSAPGWTWTKLAFFTFLIAASCVLLFFAALKSSMISKNSLISNIHSATQGNVQISGEVFNLNKTLVKAPFSDRDCYWYFYDISYIDNRDEIITIFNTQNTNLLILKDSSNECVFNINGSTNLWRPTATYKKRYAKLSDIKNEGMQAILPQLIADYGDRACTIEESIIAPGETLYLRGSFRTIDKNEVASTLLIKQTNPLNKMFSSNLSEADAALQSQQIDNIPNNRIHAMLNTSLQDKTFLTISNKTNKQMGTFAKITSISSLLVFILAGIFFIYLFIDPLGIIQRL